MATITTGYAFSSGETNVTHTKLNNAINLATISGLVAADIAANAITAAKLNSDVAGLGIKLNAGTNAVDLIGYGWTSTSLATSGNVTLTRSSNTSVQDFSNVLPAARTINLSRTNAVAGDRFFLRMDAVTVTASNTLTIQENGAGSLIVFNFSEILNGTLEFVYTGSAWVLWKTLRRSVHGTFTRTAAAGNGSQAITGLGGRPIALFFLANIISDTATGSIGFSNKNIQAGAKDSGGSPLYSTAACILPVNTSGDGYTAVVNSLDVDGFTVTWTKSGIGDDVTVSYLSIL